eukprot:gene13752-biopygen17042
MCRGGVRCSLGITAFSTETTESVKELQYFVRQVVLELPRHMPGMNSCKFDPPGYTSPGTCPFLHILSCGTRPQPFLPQMGAPRRCGAEEARPRPPGDSLARQLQRSLAICGGNGCGASRTIGFEGRRAPGVSSAVSPWEKRPRPRPVRVRSASVSSNSIVRPASGPRPVRVRCRFPLWARGAGIPGKHRESPVSPALGPPLLERAGLPSENVGPKKGAGVSTNQSFKMNEPKHPGLSGREQGGGVMTRGVDQELPCSQATEACRTALLDIAIPTTALQNKNPCSECFPAIWSRERTRTARGPDAGRTIEFKETDADRTRAAPFLPGRNREDDASSASSSFRPPHER